MLNQLPSKNESNKSVKITNNLFDYKNVFVNFD